MTDYLTLVNQCCLYKIIIELRKNVLKVSIPHSTQFSDEDEKENNSTSQGINAIGRHEMKKLKNNFTLIEISEVYYVYGSTLNMMSNRRDSKHAFTNKDILFITPFCGKWQNIRS